MLTSLARPRGAAFVLFVASACSLDNLADGVPDASSSSSTTATTDTSSSAETSATTGSFGGTGGSGGMEPSMFTWAEALSELGEQKADERSRPAVAPYKDGFVVVLTSSGDTESDVKTIIRAYEPKPVGPGYDVAWQNTLIEHATGLAEGNFRRKRALAVGGGAVGQERVVVAGTYWRSLKLDGQDVFTDDIANQAGFYIVLEETLPADDAATIVESGRTKQGAYIHSVASDGMGRLFLGGAANNGGVVDAATMQCTDMPAITVNDSAFVIALPNTASCYGAVFSPIGGSGSRTTQGVQALVRHGGRLFASGQFAPPESANSTTTFDTGRTLVRTGTSGSDVFVANLAADDLNVAWVKGFGRASTSETIADFLIDDQSVAWIAGTGGTLGCTCNGAACPNDSINFVVSLDETGCKEAVRLDAANAADPPFRSLARFAEGNTERLWAAGDLSFANTICDPTSMQPMTRSGFLIDFESSLVPDGRPIPRTGLQVGTTLPMSFARVMRLASGAPLLVGSYATEFDPALPTPAIGNGSDFFLGELAGPLPDQCTPP